MTFTTELAQTLIGKAKMASFVLEYLSNFESADIDADSVDLRFEVDGVDTGTTVSIVAECGKAAAIIDALLDELESAGKQNAQDVQIKARLCRESNSQHDRLREAEKRIAELESSETQLISERDDAEAALADMYQAATGERPEWSNIFGFADAVNAVEERLASLEASKTTPEGLQFLTEAIGAHGYIIGCLQQNRPDLALEESLKWVQVIGQAADSIKGSE